ncbi:MAG: hypothetical protein JJ903_01065, partial [Spongiibacter sp.]|nr:hypothetical protein [Spongiibacter sp.]
LPPKARWPTIQATKIAFSEIVAMFPEGTPQISPEQRRQQIAIRQQHVQRRFRVF